MHLTLRNWSLKKKLIGATFLTLVGSLMATASIWSINLYLDLETEGYLYYPLQITTTHKQTALVLGAKVHEGGRLSDMLRDRAETAWELYDQGQVEKILVSGDHGRQEYDEVNAIKDYLLAKGVKEEDLFLDHAGFDTYDSVYRARDVFEVESMIVVTQEFHLTRAVYIARALGLDAVGVVADKQGYWGIERARYREVLARVKAWLDVTLHSKPKFLGEKIPITGDSKASWDQDL